MKKTKLWGILLIAILCILSFSAISFAQISDSENHWASKEITKWQSQQVVNGYPDGTFKPGNSITRAEFFKLVNSIFNYVEKTDGAFKDVAGNAWYKDEVAKAVKAGIVKGDSNGLMHPQDYITREEAALIFARAFNIIAADRNANLSNKDFAQVAVWSKEAVIAMVEGGYMKGNSENLLLPKANITRAETVKMIDNLIKELYRQAGTYPEGETSKTIDGNVVVNTRDVKLSGLTINGNLYLSEGIGDGNVNLDNVTVKGKTIVKGGGAHSIVVNNSALQGTLYILKIDGQIRIVAQGSTSIPSVELHSGANLESSSTSGNASGNAFGNVQVTEVQPGQVITLDGDFTTVSVETTGASLQVTGGSVGTMEVSEQAVGSNITVTSGTVGQMSLNSASTVNLTGGTVSNVTVAAVATGTNISVGANAAVTTLTANASVAVTGQGTITTANINAENVKIEQKPTTTVTAEGVTSANVGGTTTTGGTTVSAPSNNTTTGGGGSGGGSTTVNVTAISVSPTTMTLTAGGATGTITKTVSPANATNQNVTWLSSDTAVATVEGGVVTPVSAGTATITATSAADGTKTATCVVTVEATQPIISSLTTTKDEVTITFSQNIVSIDLPNTITFASGTYDFDVYQDTGTETLFRLGHYGLIEQTANSMKIAILGTWGDLSTEDYDFKLYTGDFMTPTVIAQSDDFTFSAWNGINSQLQVLSSDPEEIWLAVAPINGEDVLAPIENLIAADFTLFDGPGNKVAFNFELGSEVDEFIPNHEYRLTPISSVFDSVYRVRFAATAYNPHNAMFTVEAALQATPTFSPTAGAVAFGTTVTIASAGADAIYYTTDGSDPTIASTNQAITPLVISEAGTIKALAVKAGRTNSAIGSAVYTQAAATVPSAVVLGVGNTNPVGGVMDVAIPAAGATDVTGAVYDWVTGTADVIKFTVTNGGAAASAITINADPYTSGDDYTIAAAVPLTIVVTTTEAGKVNAVRTFTVTVEEALSNIETAAIAGVTAPVTGATPVTTATETVEYTATVVWSPVHGTFAGGTAYTATITLTPKTGYTLTGVAENFFTVAGAVYSNLANSGVITAEFPATAVSVSAITGADVGITTGSIKFGYTFAGAGGAVTFAQAQVAPYYLDVAASTVQLQLDGTPGPSLVSTAIPLSSLVIGDNGEVTYTDFAAMASAFGDIENGPTHIKLHLVSKTSVNGSSVSNPWTLDTDFIPFSAGELSVFANFAATAPTNIALEVGSENPVGEVTNVAIPAVGATDVTGAVYDWVTGTANKIKFTVTNAENTTSTILINGEAYTSGADYTIAYAAPLTVVVVTAETGKMPGVRIFTVSVAGVVSGADVTGLDVPANVLQLEEITTATAVTTEVGASDWTSSDTAVATVDVSTGVVTALTAGTTTIAYTTSTSGNVNSKVITVYAAAIDDDPTIGVVQVGEANVTPTGFTTEGAGETIAWISTDETKATIDDTTGVITAVAAGDTYIAYAVVEDATGRVVVHGVAEVTVLAANVLAVGTAAANESEHTITYTLTTGTFDAVAGIVNGNWTLAGADVVDLGNITGVELSVGNTVATITVDGTVGADTKNYTVAPAQAAFAAGFTAPAAATVAITAA